MSELNGLHSHLMSGKPKILLVDDDRNILDTGKDILEDAHYVVTTASSGAEAIRKLEESEFNVVVADFQLPDFTGLEIARKVRESNEHTCVVLMTGHASLDMAVKAIQEAVYDYLIKPVDPAKLQRVIEKALEKQRLTLENRQLVADLKTSNDAMGQLNSLKTKMLKVMSHDLRTPLSSIRGYSELLRSGVKGRLTEAQKRMTEITIQEADHLNGMISDLLDLASIDSGRLTLDRRPTALGELLTKSLSRVKLFSEMKEVPLDVTAHEPLPVVDVDPVRMIQVLSNVMRASLKTAPREGKVYIKVEPKGGEVLLTVSRAGQGYSADQLKTLFGVPKGMQEPEGSQDGLRISLAIAKEIVHAHQGEIGAESAGPEQGCQFWIRLPIVKD